MILKLGLQHRGVKLCKVCITGDPWLTLTYFTARSNLVACAFELENCYKVIEWEILAANDQINRRITFLKKRNDSHGLSAPGQA